MRVYLHIRFVLLIILLATICEDCFCDNRNQMLTKAVHELCADFPRGIYTLSIVQTEFARNDSLGRLWRNELNFESAGRYYNHLDNRCDEKTDDRLLEYYCLIDTSSIALKHTKASPKYPFETEQTITGYVKSTFKTPDSFVLKVFTPSTGEMQDLDVPGNRFRLNGFDFCDGTVFTLQAVRGNGSDKSLQLYVDSLPYPRVSVKKYHVPFVNASHVEAVRQHSPQSQTVLKLQGAIELPEVMAKGRHIKPMNRMNFEPDRAIGENDPLLNIAQTMEILVSHFGLSKGNGLVKDDSDDEEISVEAFGRRSRGGFTVCEVMLNDVLLRGYELTDIIYINPLDIKQMEYFLPSNYEMFGNLADGSIKGLYGAASKRGLLMIWTKSPTAFSHYKHDKPLSVATVKQLGYMPEKMFDAQNVTSVSPTRYWNPYFIPQDFDWNLLEDVDLNDSTDYTIKAEGVSDGGTPISKQTIINLCKHQNTCYQPLAREHATSDANETKYGMDEQREKVIIQTNQQLYHRGDSIWIRCNMIDKISHRPSVSPEYPGTKSRYIYVELHDCQSDTLVQRYKIKADSLGVFANAIAIPHDMAEGYYMLVAYTRWMMNFSENDYAYKEIYILGNENPPIAPSAHDKDLAVQVYPEGGVLVPQHMQNISYTITDSQHSPQEAEVRLINAANDSIVAYSHTEYNGLGQLYFLPEDGQHYYLEAYTNRGAYGRHNICETTTDGATLQIKRRKSLVSVDILSHNHDTDRLQLYICNNGTISSVKTADSSIILSCDSFKKGKVTFVLFDPTDYSILSTRTIFVK